MSLRIPLTIFITVMLSGCATLRPEPLPAPERVVTEQPPTEVQRDFVTKFDSTSIRTALINLPYDTALAVAFSTGNVDLDDTDKIDQWLADNEPHMVAVQGTAGAMKYAHIGEQRAFNIVTYLREAGVDSVIVDYDAQRPGRQALLWPLDYATAKDIYLNAPSLVIYSIE